MKYTNALLCALALLFACAPKEKSDTATKQATKQPPNVLFIAVDDLRPELNCYGAGHIHSPNIDKLAGEGTMFQRSYCNIPVCGASRASLLTGLRSTRDRFNFYFTRADVDAPGITVLPKHFRENGYQTVSIGKVFHDQDDCADAWHSNYRDPKIMSNWRDYVLPANLEISQNKDTRGPSYENADVPDEGYVDGRYAQKAIAYLDSLGQGEKPFFLALGFKKPHLPFNAPSKYWDMYNREEIRLPENNTPSPSAPASSIHNFGELRHYSDIPKGEAPISDSLAKTLIHGYYACVSYTDAQIGKVLQALKEKGLSENTIVVLWGDHGWNLMEHGLWCKHSNYNTSLWTPLIVKAPGMPSAQKPMDLVEFIDIYPSLCDLAGLEKPSHLEGKSFVDLLAGKPDPSINRDFIITKYHQGITIKTPSHAYSEWSHSDSSTYARMLYDHQSDWDENDNIAEQEDMKAKADELSALMKAHRGKDYNVKLDPSRYDYRKK